jgi:hypothetical protein
LTGFYFSCTDTLLLGFQSQDHAGAQRSLDSLHARSFKPPASDTAKSLDRFFGVGLGFSLVDGTSFAT